jgi:membrane associated rhomboid family serine protease
MRRRLRRSWIWIPAMTIISLLGSWLGVAAGVSAYEKMDIGQAGAYAIGGAVAGAVIGVLSGAVLIQLIRRKARREAGIEAGPPV